MVNPQHQNDINFPVIVWTSPLTYVCMCVSFWVVNQPGSEILEGQYYTICRYKVYYHPENLLLGRIDPIVDLKALNELRLIAGQLQLDNLK